MPQLQFDDLHNKEQGKIGFVLGLGTSLRNHLPLLRRLQEDKKNYKIISCNNIDQLCRDIDFDYWMLAQPADDKSKFNIKNAVDRYNLRKDCTFLYTDCLDLTPREWVAENLKINYVGYDQRHWKSEPCGWGHLPGGRHICCEGLIPGRLCIQEYLQKITGHDTHYGSGDTVGVHMIALAVILGFKEVYVTGIDLDYSAGYVNNDHPDGKERTAMGMSSINHSPAMVERIYSDIEIIVRSAEKIGVKIYDMDGGGNISRVLPLKKFSDAEKVD